MALTPNYVRIAAEEAWAPPELLSLYRGLLEKQPASWDPGFRSLWGFFLGAAPRATQLVARIQDLGTRRIDDMDATGIDMQILSLTSPGVQIFDAARPRRSPATERRARRSDRSAPDRYAGLAAIAPQDPAAAAKELERGVRTLGLKGAIVNSHTQGEYLDDEKFWDIFAAAEALDVPVYIHPNTPPNDMIKPFMARGLDGAVFGFAVETGLHALRLVVSGVFDRFPKLQIVLGHLGEGLPYWLHRIDFMHGASVRPALREPAEARAKASDYLKENFYYTTSGMAWAPPIRYVQQVMGMDRLHVRDGLSVSVRARGSERHRRAADQLRGQDKLYQTNAERVFKL